MKALYHSDRGESSALLLVSKPFIFGSTPVYVPRTHVQQYNIGDTIDLPEMEIVDWVDDDGELRKAKDGSPLKKFAPVE